MVRYGFDRLLQPGSTERMRDCDWQVRHAPGHDNDAVLLFEPHRAPSSAPMRCGSRALAWCFPELGGTSGYAEVAATLDLIEQLAPGGDSRPGSVFTGWPTRWPWPASGWTALWPGLSADPPRGQVLLKYKLLEMHHPRTNLMAWGHAHAGHAARMLFLPAAALRPWLDDAVLRSARWGLDATVQPLTDHSTWNKLADRSFFDQHKMIPRHASLCKRLATAFRCWPSPGRANQAKPRWHRHGFTKPCVFRWKTRRRCGPVCWGDKPAARVMAAG